MSETAHYMNSGGSINTAAASGGIRVTRSEPEYKCQICGKPFTRVGAFGGQVPVAHDQCRRDRERWQMTAWRIFTTDETIRTACNAIDEAESERDRIYREAMLAAGIPEWFADNRVGDLHDY